MNTTELLPCPRCNGRGIDPNEPPGEDAPCWLCKGSGKSHPTPPSESSEQPKEQPVAEDAEAFLESKGINSNIYSQPTAWPNTEGSLIELNLVELMNGYARLASARAVEAERQRLLESITVEEIKRWFQLLVGIGEDAMRSDMRSWLAGEGENA